MSTHRPHRTRLLDRFKRTRARTVPRIDPASGPFWVRAFPGVGRPLVTVIVLVMCAPGEHLIGTMAGYSTRLAWGMAAVLALYAGIAAVVAGGRHKGDPGRVTANVGAWIALGLGMAAQPIAHLYVTGVWVAAPHDQVWLIVGASCVPALVLAHLLHLAATPRPAAVEDVEQPPVEDVEQPPVEDVEQSPVEDVEPSPYGAAVWVTVPEAAAMTGRAESTVRGWLTDPERGLVTRTADDGRRVMIDASTLPTIQLKLASG